MKLIRLLLVMISSIALSAIVSVGYAQENKSAAKKATIAVMSYDDFVPDRTGVQNSRLIGLPDVLATRIIEHLTNSKRFDAVERNALRRMVLEQRFEKPKEKNYLDKSLDKAIDKMENLWGPEIDATAFWSNHHDIVKDFQDLGSLVKADFIVYGDLEKLTTKSQALDIPYTNAAPKVVKKTVDARLRLRVIKVDSGQIIGASSIKTRLSEQLFVGIENKNGRDEFSKFDALGKQAAVKILDMTFPAKVVSLDPLIISRGGNDGVKVGDRYTIIREGKEIKDSNGTILGYLKSEIGSVEVSNVQKNIAIVNALNNETFQMGDLAELELQSNVQSHTASKSKKSQSKNGAQKFLAMGKLRLNRSAKTSGGFNRNHVKRISDEMHHFFSDGKRFQMMERAEVDQLLDEKIFTAITAGDDLSPYLAEFEGADFLIHGEIVNFYATRKSERVPYVDEVQVITTVYAEGNFRIADVHNSRVLGSENVRIKKELKKIQDEGQIMSDLIQQFARQAVNQITLKIYPIKVMASTPDGTVYLNRGADAGLKIGQEFRVMRPGQDIIDPDTGLSFGTTETQIARVKVVEVQVARSLAQVISGKEPQSGDLLRRPKQKKAKKRKPQRVMQPNW